MNLQAWFNPDEGHADRYYEYKILASTTGEDGSFTVIADHTGTDNRTWNTPEGESDTFESVKARYIRIEHSATRANGQPNNHNAHLRELQVYGTLCQDETHNLIAYSSVSASGAEEWYPAENAADGDVDSFWGAEGPAALYVDLNGIYDLSSIQVIPYFSDDRCYNYEIYTSLDGRDYTLYGEKKDETPQTRQGETYTKDQEAVRSVMISMLSNSKNPSVHLNEVRIMGKLNTSATPPEDEDENNLALNCPVYVSSQQDGMNKASLTDGDNHTAWAPEFNPAYAQIDLEQNVKISSIQVIPPVTMGSEEYAQYSVYASLDGETYDRSARKTIRNLRRLPVKAMLPKAKKPGISGFLPNTAPRRIRCRSVKSVSMAKNQKLSCSRLQKMSVESFEKTDYAKSVTDEETLEQVRGVVARTVGEQLSTGSNLSSITPQVIWTGMKSTCTTERFASAAIKVFP